MEICENDNGDFDKIYMWYFVDKIKYILKGVFTWFIQKKWKKCVQLHRAFIMACLLYTSTAENCNGNSRDHDCADPCSEPDDDEWCKCWLWDVYKRQALYKSNHVCLPCDLSRSHFTGLPSRKSFVIARSGKGNDKSRSATLSIAFYIRLPALLFYQY